ncbi:MAG: hypothetical protein OHK0039_13510 [Bacteroidia bacterium]
MHLSVTISKLVAFCVLLGLNLGFAQQYKAYYRYSSPATPLKHTLKDLAVSPDNKAIVLAGELTEGNGGHMMRGYVLRIEGDGKQVFSTSLFTTFSSGFNGLEINSVALDKAGNYYLGGTSLQHPGGSGGGSERTFTSLDADGKWRWSSMQPNYSFVSVDYDPLTKVSAALSGPYGYQPLPDMMLSRFDPDGNLLDAVSIETSTADHPVKVLSLPQYGGYLVAGILDTTDARRIFLVRLDEALQLRWSRSYGSDLQAFDLRDVAMHPDGFFVAGGSATDRASGQSHPFILTVDDEAGDPIIYEQYTLGTYYRARGTRVAAFGLGADQDGFLLGGSYSVEKPVQSERSFVIRIDRDGGVVWARSYGNLYPSDLTIEENLGGLALLPGTGDFVAAGASAGHIDQEVRDRAIWLVRASVATGRIDEQGTHCSEAIWADRTHKAALIYGWEGEVVAGGGASGFSYLTEGIDFSDVFCSYLHSPEAVPQDTEDIVKPLYKTSVAQPGAIVLSYDPGLRQQGRATLHDLAGRTLGQARLVPGRSKATLPTTGLATGVYVLRIEQPGLPLRVEKVRIP